jgi:hypothetical protein
MGAEVEPPPFLKFFFIFVLVTTEDFGARPVTAESAVVVENEELIMGYNRGATGIDGRMSDRSEFAEAIAAIGTEFPSVQSRNGWVEANRLTVVIPLKL